MLQFIIPPIIVVLSLVGIIIFLVKRSHRIKEVPESIASEPVLESKNIFSRIGKAFSSFIAGIKWRKLGGFFGFILRGISRGLKNIFSGLERKFSQKKNKKPEEDSEEDMTEWKQELGEEEPAQEPILSNKIVSPKNKAEIKDRLEDDLIERIALNPKDVEAYERLGEYYLEIENYDHARDCYKQVIKLSPSNRAARHKLERLNSLLTKE